jgi:hypothetical protein
MRITSIYRYRIVLYFSNDVVCKGSCPIIVAMIVPQFTTIDHRGCAMVCCGSVIVVNIHNNKPQYIYHADTTPRIGHDPLPPFIFQCQLSPFILQCQLSPFILQSQLSPFILQGQLSPIILYCNCIIPESQSKLLKL